MPSFLKIIRSENYHIIYLDVWGIIIIIIIIIFIIIFGGWPSIQSYAKKKSFGGLMAEYLGFAGYN